MNGSKKLFEASGRVIPGGVNSPVRAFRAVGREPVFISRADGAYMFDVDGNKYLDYVMSWGPMILGHNDPSVRQAVIEAAADGLSFGAATPRELTMAETIVKITGVEMVRMVNSGTESVMSALRLARGYTKRDKIIKFDGCYHGHSDSMLVKAGSGLMTMGTPDSAGVTEGVAKDTLIAKYNDLDSVKELFARNKNEIAAVILEPVCANMGVVTPAENFLKDLRQLCTSEKALLIFDEVITGFRLAPGGAQELYNVKADIVTYGKIIGGGMPVGAYGGSREIMDYISPVGPVYQAGTLSGNPIAMAAGLKQLEILTARPEIYTTINDLGQKLRDGLRDIINKRGLDDAYIDGVGSLCCLFVGRERYPKFFAKMLEAGIYLAPSQFEAMFISAAHTEENIDETLEAADAALGYCYSNSREI